MHLLLHCSADPFGGELIPYEHQEIAFTEEISRAVTPALEKVVSLAYIVRAANPKDKMNNDIFGRYIACKVMDASFPINDAGPKRTIKDLVNRLLNTYKENDFKLTKPSWWDAMLKTLDSFRGLEDDAVVEAVNAGKDVSGAYSALYE